MEVKKKWIIWTEEKKRFVLPALDVRRPPRWKGPIHSGGNGEGKREREREGGSVQSKLSGG